MTDAGLTLTDDGTILPIRGGELRPSLVELAGGQIGRRYFLEDKPLTIGRADEAQIRINDARSSRRHAVVEAVPDTSPTEYVVLDLDSRNGTFVNSQRISRAKLQEGDKIQIGTTIFRFSQQDTVELEFEQKIYQLAITDPLTGLHTRDYFAGELKRHVSRCLRHERCMSVVMLDLDNFKRVNDTYGHQTGDRVLEVAAALLKDALRNEDVIGRYGGEELIVLLPETAPEAALIPTERFLKNFANQRIDPPEGAAFNVTASAGIAGLPEHAVSEHDLIRLADAALYTAKETGKNRVVVAENKLQPKVDTTADPVRARRRPSRPDDITQGQR